MSNELTAVLEQIQADHDAANAFGANASDPTPRLLAALEAVLELAGKDCWGTGVPPYLLREAITRKMVDR